MDQSCAVLDDLVLIFCLLQKEAALNCFEAVVT